MYKLICPSEEKKIEKFVLLDDVSNFYVLHILSIFFLLTYIYILLILLVATAIRKRDERAHTPVIRVLSLSLSRVLVLLIFRFVNTNLSFSSSHSVVFYDLCIKKMFFTTIFHHFPLLWRLRTEPNKLL
jgi:hypothetical protein